LFNALAEAGWRIDRTEEDDRSTTVPTLLGIRAFRAPALEHVETASYCRSPIRDRGSSLRPPLARRPQPSAFALGRELLVQHRSRVQTVWRDDEPRSRIGERQ
jgi:hypothetical protein